MSRGKSRATAEFTGYHQPGGVTGNAQNLPNNMVPYKATHLDYIDAQEIAYPINGLLDAADYAKRFLEKQCGIEIGKAPSYDTSQYFDRLIIKKNGNYLKQIKK